MMRTLRAQCVAAAMAVAFVIGLATSAIAQDPEAEAKRAAEAKAAADAKTAAGSASVPGSSSKKAAEARATAEDRANADARARRGVRPGDVQKVFTLKHVRVDDMARVLSVFPAEISGMERVNMHVLSVSAAQPVLAAIEETIKRLDVPSPPVKNVELTAYVLECSPSGDGGTVPADLQDVVGQLKRTFNYSGCVLARTLFTRAADGSRIELEAREGAAGIYYLNASLLIDSTESAVVRLRRLRFQNVSPTQGGNLSGDVDIRDGQRVVLGRLGTTESGKHQIVVLAAKLVP
jgi:hypothetical protein